LLVDEQGVISAVLDCQLSTVAAPIFDLGQLVSGVLMFSRRIVDEVSRQIHAEYRDIDGLPLLPSAMVAYWLVNYWVLRDEALVDGRLKKAVVRQPARLRDVFAFAESR
jgi:aminoglycoside phosphotransferase (APT) family kinase protein